MKSAAFGLALCLAAGLSGVCWAQDLKATQKHSDTVLGFETGSGYSNYTLTVTGPNGFHATAASKDTTPAIDLRRAGATDDGNYSYQLTAASTEKIPNRTPLDNGRSGGPTDTKLRAVALSGHFLVKGGKIVEPSSARPARLDKDAR